MNALSKFTADRRLTSIVWLALRLLLAYEWLSAGLEKVQEAVQQDALERAKALRVVEA